jgi:hypothetical protein
MVLSVVNFYINVYLILKYCVNTLTQTHVFVCNLSAESTHVVNNTNHWKWYFCIIYYVLGRKQEKIILQWMVAGIPRI